MLPAQFVCGGRAASTCTFTLDALRCPSRFPRTPCGSPCARGEPSRRNPPAAWPAQKGLVMRFANRTGTRAAIATAAAGALAAGAFAVVMSASASPSHSAGMHGVMGVHVVGSRTAYGFRTVDNAADLTFNQLLGINNEGVIAGYFGSGAQGHPNMGYQLTPAGYRSENVPGSVQTQVTGLNDSGVTVGFAASMNNASLVSDSDVAVGFYVDGNGNGNTDGFAATPQQRPSSYAKIVA